MTVSEITIEILKNYLRIDGSDDDVLLNHILQASIDYVCNYTGRTLEELEMYNDIPLAVLCLCSQLYENREYTTDKININPAISQILGSHSNNLL
ncbi:uncharacterized phage protein (possible DNA packaging) [Anaerovibrio lipolyticus DSM 3074]|uniref:Uncharacterized phage protein (Possible DNA packaging) n=1 Tax=Anaerovibrio lipolyticus DSM 3074 TaxID=1120997 RepID=A0A1M6G7M5_9FIRM|nr:head-tail connector protein [Anaerovibrio lipolyticus]SHJ05991.1 uncharacterized phage protein (possible DNA packaging) [Anaerovibrio lipolyticus DSM 3074]